MVDDVAASPPAGEDLDPQVALDTGIRGQRLLIQGWFASHADSGVPGPHVRLHVSGDMDAVLKTSQIPVVIEGLNLVTERIDEQWRREGEGFLRTSFSEAPDPNDPRVGRKRRIEDLELHDLVSEHWPEIATIIAETGTTDDAVERIAAMLGVDEVRVLVRLSRFSLFSLTRGARTSRAKTLDELRREL